MQQSYCDPVAFAKYDKNYSAKGRYEKMNQLLD